MKSKITNMTGKLSFTYGRWGREHPGPTYYQDFALMPSGKLILLLMPCIWNAYLFDFLAWLPFPVKKYLTSPDYNVH